MSLIPENVIDAIAKNINDRVNKRSTVPVSTVEDDSRTPHYFEIIPFDQIDISEIKFFAIDGSYLSQEFQNGVGIGLYSAGYVCFSEGKQVKLNVKDDITDLGIKYVPNNILITNEIEKIAIFDELLELQPVKNFISFCNVADSNEIWGLGEKTFELIISSISKLLSFCQEVLEWALVYEILTDERIVKGDYILRDGTLRSNNIKQDYLVKIGRLAKEKGVKLLAVTKDTPIKMELSSAFKEIDTYLEETKKPTYPFTIANENWQKICCWFEVDDRTLIASYPESTQKKKFSRGEITSITHTSMFAKTGLKGGRGFGIFFVARLDYVEKLQNYDWVVLDLNIFDVIPAVKETDSQQEIYAEARDILQLHELIKPLTRLTQEHYILGYPYPLVEAHNYVTLRHTFKDEIVARVKGSLYFAQRMDNVEIENMFLDIHSRF